MHRTENPTAPAADTDDLSPVTPADILRGAALYLENHGWTRGNYYTPNAGPFPPACADGAIGMAAYGRVTTCPGLATEDPGYRGYNLARDYFGGYLEQAGYRPPCEPWCEGGTDCACDSGAAEIVFAWNDELGRNGLQVIAGLNKAAHDWDRTHGGVR
jgi:hypothetical protein